MFARKKLRKIFEKNRYEFEKDYFKKFKPPPMDIHVNNFDSNEKKLRNENENENEKYRKPINNFEMLNEDKLILKDLKATADVTAFVKTHSTSPETEPEPATETETDLELVDLTNLDTFHRAVRPIFILAQCFALMPIVAVNNSNPCHMHFTYKSLQMLITITFLTSNGFLLMAMTKHLTGIGINAKNFVGLVFFSCCQFACILFLIAAKRWPSLIKTWTRLELIFERSPYESAKRCLRKRVRFAASVIICCSILEHILYHISSVLTYRRKILICSQLQNKTGHLSFGDYIISNYGYVFSVFTYNTTFGIFVLIVSGVSTFIWNYMDLFIMMVSNGIAYRFEQIMMRINRIAKKDVSERVFIEIRVHYVKVCELLDKIDDHLSSIILLSCVNNLYFVCNQLLNIFNKLRWPINYIYFWYSLIYLIGRTAFVFLTAASINDQSKAALSSLRSVSDKAWCIEVERLIFQMTTQTVALSGKKFYFLTRRLLFGMAGTIVTYELVLLQFDEPNRTQGLPPLCE